MRNRSLLLGVLCLALLTIATFPSTSHAEDSSSIEPKEQICQGFFKETSEAKQHITVTINPAAPGKLPQAMTRVQWVDKTTGELLGKSYDTESTVHVDPKGVAYLSTNNATVSSTVGVGFDRDGKVSVMSFKEIYNFHPECASHNTG